MKCIYCGHLDSKVIDSRSAEQGSVIRRRRECLKCLKRFTTYEMVESSPILVIKNDGTRQQFDPSKIKSGIIKACEKRAVSMASIDRVILEIEKEIQNSLADEIHSNKIGELVMKHLKTLDEVAYIRFASVYRKFSDVTTFMDFVKEFEQKE